MKVWPSPSPPLKTSAKAISGAGKAKDMSVTAAATKAIGLPEIARHKGGTPLVCLTAYTTQMAELVDPCGDIVLVGDSLVMVLHGLESTLGLHLEMELWAGKWERMGIAGG